MHSRPGHTIHSSFLGHPRAPAGHAEPAVGDDLSDNFSTETLPQNCVASIRDYASVCGYTHGPEFAILMVHRPDIKIVGCSLTIRGKNSVYLRILLFTVPEVVILGTYPVIAYLRCERAMARVHRVAPSVRSLARPCAVSVDNPRSALESKAESTNQRPSYAVARPHSPYLRC